MSTFYSKDKYKKDGGLKKLGGGARDLIEIKHAGGMSKFKETLFNAGEESMANRIMPVLGRIEEKVDSMNNPNLYSNEDMYEIKINL